MVRYQTRKRKTLMVRFLTFLAKMLGVLLISALISTFFTSLVIVGVYKAKGEPTSQAEDTNETVGYVTPNSDLAPSEPDFTNNDTTPEPKKEIDFQAVVETWAKKAGGKAGVYIYDLDNEKVLADYNGNVRFATASLYKLFVVYEGYRRLETGEWSGDTKVGSTGKTISQCLDLAIRESHSPCAESLHSMIGYNNMASIIKNDFGLNDTSARNLYSTPEEIAKMMKIFYEHSDIKNVDNIAQMKDSFLNQPKTTYDWRRGLPKGFSDKVDVYNKVGWEYVNETKSWKIYDDAAIVVFKNENRHFIVVEMTSGVSLTNINKLATAIEEVFYEAY